jgi:hypothetical protein
MNNYEIWLLIVILAIALVIVFVNDKLSDSRIDSAVNTRDGLDKFEEGLIDGQASKLGKAWDQIPNKRQQ